MDKKKLKLNQIGISILLFLNLIIAFSTDVIPLIFYFIGMGYGYILSVFINNINELKRKDYYKNNY